MSILIKIKGSLPPRTPGQPNAMTLEAYDPARLDQLSLRLMDVVCQLRHIAAIARENRLEKVVLHDHKAREWIARLETWARQSSQRVQKAAAPKGRSARRR